MSDSDDPIDLVITSKGWQPGFPKPCDDPVSLAHLLKTREMLVRAGNCRHCLRTGNLEWSSSCRRDGNMAIRFRRLI